MNTAAGRAVQAVSGRGPPGEFPPDASGKRRMERSAGDLYCDRRLTGKEAS